MKNAQMGGASLNTLLNIDIYFITPVLYQVIEYLRATFAPRVKQHKGY